MSILIFNLVGVVMLGACFAAAYAVGVLVGTTAEDVLMAVAGPLLFGCDLLYRRNRKAGPAPSAIEKTDGARRWYHPRYGGHLLFIPIWALGLFWMLLGTFRLVF
jgi:hypothetical protein